MRKMKKFILSALALLTVAVGALGAFSCGVEDNSSTASSSESKPSIESQPSEGLEFKKSTAGRFYQLVGIGGCTDTELVIPSQYKDLPVTIIAENAFNGCTNLISVEIPDSVTEIKAGAFSACSSLTDVVISKSVTTIGEDAFSNCENLAKIYYTGLEEDWIEIAVSSGNTSITSAIRYEYTQTQPLQNGLYWHYNDVGKVQVWENIYSEGLLYAFNRDTQSYTVAGIGDCTDTEVVIPGIYDNQAVTSVWGYALANCSKVTRIILPDGITTIGNYAFADCSSLVSVKLPESVVSIGDSVFSNCTSLISINIPQGVTRIEKGLFFNCVSLTELSFPKGLISIGKDAFSGCLGLTSIEIPDGVTSIAAGAFFECASLIKIKLPSNLVSIGSNAFSDCTGLTSIELPNSITSIGFSAFYNCSNLISIYYKGTAEEWGKISIDSYNEHLSEAIRYYYSEIKPAGGGDYWHYDANGDIAVW